MIGYSEPQKVWAITNTLKTRLREKTRHRRLIAELNGKLAANQISGSHSRQILNISR